MVSNETPNEKAKTNRPPATTPEAQENRLIALAISQAESMLESGKAPTSMVNYLLKLGTTRESLEKEKLNRENELLRAKVDAIESGKEVRELYAEALQAMRSYSGGGDDNVDSA